MRGEIKGRETRGERGNSLFISSLEALIHFERPDLVTHAHASEPVQLNPPYDFFACM